MPFVRLKDDENKRPYSLGFLTPFRKQVDAVAQTPTSDAETRVPDSTPQGATTFYSIADNLDDVDSWTFWHAVPEAEWLCQHYLRGLEHAKQAAVLLDQLGSKEKKLKDQIAQLQQELLRANGRIAELEEDRLSQRPEPAIAPEESHSQETWTTEWRVSPEDLPEDLEQLLENFKNAQDFDFYGVNAAGQALSNFSSEELAPHLGKLLEVLQNEPEDSMVWFAISKAFSKLSPEDLGTHCEVLVDMLGNPQQSCWVRDMAGQALSQVLPENLATHSNTLLSILQNPNEWWWVRDAAGQALSKLFPTDQDLAKEVLMELTPMIESEECMMVVGCWCEALKSYKALLNLAPKYIMDLTALSDDHWYQPVRTAACEALCRREDALCRREKDGSEKRTVKQKLISQGAKPTVLNLLKQECI